jgi:hypothetical protein
LLLYFEIEQHVWLEIVFVAPWGHLCLESPFQAFEGSYLAELLSKYCLS